LAGIYPAFYLTRFKPVYVLKGIGSKGSKGVLLRRILIIFQFTISIVLIIGTLTVKKQLEYFKNKDTGLTKETVIQLPLPRSLLRSSPQKVELLKDILIQNPSINKVTTSNFRPGYMGGNTYNRDINDVSHHLYYIMTDHDFVDVFGLNIIKGRDFSQTDKGEIGRAILLNEAAVKEFGLKDPIGQEIYLFDTIGVIVGVVEDFNFRSLHHTILPLSILYIPAWSRAIQINMSSNNIARTLDFIEKEWGQLTPEFQFEYSIIDEEFAKLYKSEQNFGKIFVYFAILAIFIACMGLYGLVSFTAIQRTKEICVRKVNGASIQKIIFILTKELSKWVLVSFVVACPIAYYVLEKWLQNFPYHTDQSIWLFIVAGIIAFVIALATMSFQAYKAANRNPVEGLRYE